MTKVTNTGVRERVLGVLESTMETMVDFDQRSAIGMARTHVEEGKPIARQVNVPALYKKRDDLAEALVVAMAGGSQDECIAALGKAREIVNAPFEDPKMAGYRAARLKVGLVGSDKKNSKLEK